MRKRVARRILAIVLCLGISFGVFDGIPFVKENLSGVTEVEAATNPYSGMWSNCTWAAWQKTKELTGIELPGWGNAVDWLASAKNAGFSTGMAPREKSIAVWRWNPWGPGHVAYVSKVSGNRIYVLEGGYNSGSGKGYHEGWSPSSGYRYGATSKYPDYLIGYIYLPVNQPVSINYTITTGNASNITNNTARISSSMSPAGNVSEWGFYIGTNTNSMSKITVSRSSTYSGSMVCDVQNYYGLKYGTTYYYRTWANINGSEKQGANQSFNTTATKPNIPTLKISTASQNIGISDSGTVSWSATTNAKYYKLYLYDSNNKLLETSENVTGTKYAFSPSVKAGTYRAYIEAYNEVGTKGKSNAVTFTVHPDVTVTFMDADSFVDVGEDYEPAELGKQTIHYGKAATAPSNPEHTGYTFKKWSKAFTNVKEDIVVKAEYTINQYTVKYVDSTNEDVLGTEKVDYYSSANPVDFKLPTGYVKTGYDGWDKDYKCITENITLRTSIGWYNDNFPIYAELLSAVREYDAEESDNEGYTIQAKVTNWDKSTTKGRVIVALKTKEGKLLTSTESSAFSVKKNANKTIEVFVPYNKAASIAEIYVVGQYTDAVPITTTASNNATLEIDQTAAKTNWSTEKPAEDAIGVEERKEYRYQTKTTTNSYETSLSGYTCSGSSWQRIGGGNIDYIPSFPYGFNTGSAIYQQYNKKPVTASETATSKTTVSTGQIGYLYYHWCRNGNYSGNLKNRLVNGVYTSQYWNFHAFTTGSPLGWDSRGAFYADYPHICNDTYWWIGNGEGNSTNVPIYCCTYNNYRKLFSYYKWSDFSDWSTTPQNESSTRKVESRTVYRYLDKELMKEDISGEERTIEGSMGEEFAGKEATLFIYKVDEASDYTNEYVAQTTLDENGDYKFTFKLREEPSIKTGDMTVALGVEGNSTAIYLDTIEAPKKEHTVRFINYNGDVISTQKVEEGKAAELPSEEKTKRVGYTFTKWSDTNINITEDKDIYAEYALNKYNVVFVDWRANTVKVEEFEYGSKLVTPLIEDVEDDEVAEWDLVAQGVDIVTTDLIVCTQYKKRTFDVKILGFNGEVIDEQTVEYGKAVSLPKLDEEKNNCIFFGWRNIAEGASEDFVDTIIKKETILAPNFIYNDTVETPIASVETGEYSKEQTITLTTTTKGASIYYTLDGSDPSGVTGVKYTKPIVVKDATKLRFFAKADKMNVSEEVVHYYVINYSGARSDWMPYAELPEQIRENQSKYDIYSDIGYSYKDVKEVELKSEVDALKASGWKQIDEKMSEYTEWQDSPIIDDGTYTGVEVDSKPIYSQGIKYQYTRFAYKEGDSISYSPVEIEGVEGKTEELLLDNSMVIGGFLEDGTTYFIRDGEYWFNQKKIVGNVETGKQYRSRHKILTYAKWSKYSIDIPNENEEREYKESEVFSYVRHNKYIVNIYTPIGSVETKLMEEGETIALSELKKLEGYEYEGLYTDENYENKWNPEKDSINKNLSLYAKVNPKQYTVTFKDSDGNKIDTQTVSYMEEANEPKIEEITGEMRFVRWSSNDYKCVSENLEVTAEYIPTKEYATVSFDKSSMTLASDESLKLNATIEPLSQSEELLIWESSDNSIAYVSDQGVVTAVREGNATIQATVTTTGEVAKCNVRVENKVVDKDDSNNKDDTIGKDDVANKEPIVTTPTPLPADKPGNNTQHNASVPSDNNDKKDFVNKTDETIAIKKVSALKVSNKKKKSFTATWKKMTGAKGYQVQYAENKKFKKKKSKFVAKNKITIKKLKKKKTYYIRVRAYKLNGKKKLYGKWSSVKKVKIKK